ncbi:WD repeat-containing protein 27 [Frankliniella fusca]|uniref:WD repeat-containing protein 27 n=1 Tax=Frankliniella fusca TaxID=407009 RepID=A0AAE1LMD9_9NEOP|nr:WD repeat-containing protein 27 [Frankliniella fusca]
MDFDFQVESAANEICKNGKCSPVSTENGFIMSNKYSSLILWTNDVKVALDTEHRSPVTSLCISAASSRYICSCSDDKVILWNLNDFYSENTEIYRKPSKGLLVGISLGPIQDCAISSNNGWLALCRESDVWVVCLQHANDVLTAVSHHTTLEASGEPPSLCCFSPTLPDILVTTDDSNSFKVWNVESGVVSQRSAVGGWHRISYCEFVGSGTFLGHLLVGTNRGSIHLFSISPNKPPRDLVQVSAVPSVCSSVFITAKPDGNENDCSNGEHSNHPNFQSEMRLAVRPPTTPPGPGESCEAGCVVLGSLLVDAEADELEEATEAEAEAPGPRGASGGPHRGRHPEVGAGARQLLDEDFSLVSAAALTGRTPSELRCLLCSGPKTYLIRVVRAPGPATAAAASAQLSFLPTSTLGARSPLRARFAKPAVDATAKAYGASSRPSRKGVAPRPVKSSGYGEVSEPRPRFTPAINQPRRPPPRLPAATRGAGVSGGRGLLSRIDGDLMRTWTPPLKPSSRVRLWHEGSAGPGAGAPVLLAASGDGQSLACSCGQGVLSVLRWARPSVDDDVRIAGHDARVTAVDFSADSSWLLSASSDGRTKVWDWRERRCVLDVDVQGGASAKGAARAGDGRRGHAVAQASFFYLDRFILRAVGRAVELICHRLHDQSELGLPRPGLSGPRGSRLVRRIEFPTQEVLCFAAPNAFHSGVLVAGCASRSLHVYDVGAERFLAEIRDAHPRPPHALALATASAGAGSARAADLFVSAAACDGAKLWDLRQTRCVQKFSRHLNRAHSCGVALSACCRYLAVGSEDKCVYVYDTRKSVDFVDKLMGLNDVVLDVTWNSCKPQLAASAINSLVAVYASQ